LGKKRKARDYDSEVLESEKMIVKAQRLEETGVASWD
jgi:hypothetical protein